ncbi:MAG: acetyl/propionyl/methylcrotonyl-CoA carboxylase subunit alpha [Gammaproteobacteria bacterium]|nr:acetyl/propionyl/methylcrotonyl-CoA carboxylase subunit alpha [Gammaproteobacteria bacterium]
MFKKILIANRGEIACRIIASAKRMGIATVAVYSEADRDIRHVREADEAICIGKPPAAESYLNGDRIIAACQDSGAEAIHPGYGFLSENAEFAEKLQAAGIAFIGPKACAIRAMGDKITSKKLAAEAGVNTIPGFDGVVPDADRAVEIADEIGYPVIIKASAGGGGKGMRIAHDKAECREGFERATSEAQSSFGDGRIFIEKFISNPRHIEIQVLADGHGHAIALNERECSIQRRYQKVVEEAPSVFLNDETRSKMMEQAVALAKAVNYQSAGTVEMVVDERKNFYFLEMNTRLQVEHPITEMITGVDLVEWMIRIADGEHLTIQQKDVGINGWSMEARIYAENPSRGFLPSTGRIRKYRAPPTSQHVRLDTGIEEGSEISMFYDPMIAKLITWGESREQAMQAMNDSLNRYYIRGVDTNIAFLSSILNKPDFRSGKFNTSFIEKKYPNNFSMEPIDATLHPHVMSAISAIHHRHHIRAGTISGQIEGYGRHVNLSWVVIMEGIEYLTRIQHDEDDNGITVEFEEGVYKVVDDWTIADPVYAGRVGDKDISFQIEKSDFRYDIVCDSYVGRVMVCRPETARLNRLMPVKAPPDHSRYLLSPMPGLLVSLSVEVGQKIKPGEELAVIEAMKMENSLQAEQSCVVAGIFAEPGDKLEVDQPILEFEQGVGETRI